jgi:hypothetical protein
MHVEYIKARRLHSNAGLFVSLVLFGIRAFQQVSQCVQLLVPESMILGHPVRYFLQFIEINLAVPLASLLLNTHQPALGKYFYVL